LFAAVPEKARFLTKGTQNPKAPADALSGLSGRDVFYTPCPGSAGAGLFEIYADAYDAVIDAWLSEYPIDTEIVSFAWKVIAAAWDASFPEGFSQEAALVSAGGKAEGPGLLGPAARKGAEKAASDRGDPAVRTVLEAAYKVRRESERLKGLLRFSPGEGGVYTARCAPDHFVLPTLAPHFTRRFGETPWIIVDEKRGLALFRRPGEEPALVPGPYPFPGAVQKDPWEELWRVYHHSVNNETRKNPGLQRQFIPVRYWKYLPELAEKNAPGDWDKAPPQGPPLREQAFIPK
jgi:hypothetical protein